MPRVDPQPSGKRGFCGFLKSRQSFFKIAGFVSSGVAFRVQLDAIGTQASNSGHGAGFWIHE